MKVLLALSILIVAAGALALMLYTWFLLLPEEQPPRLYGYDEMDEQALIYLETRRRTRVLSETGYLPPSIDHLHLPPRDMRAAEDCQ